MVRIQCLLLCVCLALPSLAIAGKKSETEELPDRIEFPGAGFAGRVVTTEDDFSDEVRKVYNARLAKVSKPEWNGCAVVVDEIRDGSMAQAAGVPIGLLLLDVSGPLAPAVPACLSGDDPSDSGMRIRGVYNNSAFEHTFEPSS